MIGKHLTYYSLTCSLFYFNFYCILTFSGSWLCSSKFFKQRWPLKGIKNFYFCHLFGSLFHMSKDFHLFWVRVDQHQPEGKEKSLLELSRGSHDWALLNESTYELLLQKRIEIITDFGCLPKHCSSFLFLCLLLIHKRFQCLVFIFNFFLNYSQFADSRWTFKLLLNWFSTQLCWILQQKNNLKSSEILMQSVFLIVNCMKSSMRVWPSQRGRWYHENKKAALLRWMIYMDCLRKKHNNLWVFIFSKEHNVVNVIFTFQSEIEYFSMIWDSGIILGLKMDLFIFFEEVSNFT